MNKLEIYTNNFDLAYGVSGTAFLEVDGKGSSFLSIDRCLEYVHINDIRIDQIGFYYQPKNDEVLFQKFEIAEEK